MNSDKILVIDDEAGIRSSLKGILEDEGYKVKTVSSGENALALLKSEPFDLILLDIWLPEMNGIEVLEKIKAGNENIHVVMITGHGSVESAVKATKLGAYDFLEKPLSLEKVVLTAKNALKQLKLEEENIQLRERIKTKYRMIGNSPTIKKLQEQIKTAAASKGSVLITGENGTGKELVAHLIHQQSARRNKRFIQINCAAIPEDLMEGELFGYAQGTLPNINRDKKGKLFLTDGGTLFLDEIADLSPKIQASLLGFMKEEKFEPIGSDDTIRSDVRIITATDKNLRQMIAEETFRKDLFYKLNIIPMVIPSLRERKEDIPDLIDYFLQYFSLESGKKRKTMNKEAMQAFINYSWPGNVSELINVIERFVIMVKEDEIHPNHLNLLVEPRESQFLPGFFENIPLSQAREQFEREYIHNALIRNEWDIPKAAHDLNLDPNALTETVKQLGINFLG